MANLLWPRFVIVLAFFGLSEAPFTQQQVCHEFISPMSLRAERSVKGNFGIPVERGSGQDYAPNQLCEWIITARNDADYIQLEVTDCFMEGRNIHNECDRDYVDIFDVNGMQKNFLGRFCSTDRGAVFQSKGHKVLVAFRTNTYQQYLGFRMNYISKDPDISSGELSAGDTLILVVGICVGIMVMVVVVVVGFVLRRYLRRKATTHSPVHLQEGSRPEEAAVAPPDQPPRYSVNNPHVRRQYDDSNSLLQRSLPMGPPPVVEGPSTVPRAATPPPAYDSLDHAMRMSPHGSDMVALPSYDVIFKEILDEQPGAVV